MSLHYNSARNEAAKIVTTAVLDIKQKNPAQRFELVGPDIYTYVYLDYESGNLTPECQYKSNRSYSMDEHRGKAKRLYPNQDDAPVGDIDPVAIQALKTTDYYKYLSEEVQKTYKNPVYDSESMDQLVDELIHFITYYCTLGEDEGWVEAESWLYDSKTDLKAMLGEVSTEDLADTLISDTLEAGYKLFGVVEFLESLREEMGCKT